MGPKHNPNISVSVDFQCHSIIKSTLAVIGWILNFYLTVGVINLWLAKVYFRFVWITILFIYLIVNTVCSMTKMYDN